MAWDDDLHGPAREIAESDAERLRVLAGPGTGKTFAVIRRVARLLEEGAVPARVLVCTFTRTAAADLKRELCKLSDCGGDKVRAGTLHSYCFSVLANEAVLQITGRVPRPLLTFEERFLLEDLKHLTGRGVDDCGTRLKAFSADWARLQSDQPGWPRDEADRRFQSELVNWLRFHRAMLLGELVPEALRYIRNNPLCPERRAFDHVVVDEYQDLDRADQVLLDILSENGTLTVVGDEDQSVYESLRYAHPEGIAEFPTCHPGTEDHNLDECRRCPKLVVRLANNLIANNASRTPKTLVARTVNADGEVHVVQWLTPDHEATGVAEFIRSRIESGSTGAGQVLVLSPRRHLGYAVRDALDEAGVPAHSFFHEEALHGKPKELDECRAQEAFTLLTLLADRGDRVAARCWCGFGSPSLRAGEWERLRAYCHDHSGEPMDVLARLAAGETRIPNTTGIVDRYRELQGRLGGLQDLAGQELLDVLFPEEDLWASAIREIARSAMADDDESTELTGMAADVLKERLRVGITQPELPTDVEYVRVMSLHKSKGLTADLVVVLGCIDGLIPSLPERATDAEVARALEEQRRLFYVAVTRTRSTLLLSALRFVPGRAAHQMRASSKPMSTEYVRTTASPFLHELGPELPPALAGDELLQMTGSTT